MKNYLEQNQEEIASGAIVLRKFALSNEELLLTQLQDVLLKAPLRHMTMAGGFRMSVAMSNCGSLGWLTDKTGYRYDAIDPLTTQNWPPIPDVFLKLAAKAAAQAKFFNFLPDACLISRYKIGAKLSLHQDKDEKNFQEPVVSVSLGISAIFLFGGLHRTDKPLRVLLNHGDVVVWGGPSRLRYHGVMPIKNGSHETIGNCRLNLSFRKAG
jgi:alkylated DNA repair protein (DNA oxidative demethylase)